MRRYFSYLNTAKEILKEYNGQEPFVHYIKKYFSQFKKFGSSDRKHISMLCYDYFRCFHALKGRDLAEQLIQSVFVCESESPMLQALDPALVDSLHLPGNEKLALLQADFNDVFPFAMHLSNEINQLQFSASILMQPRLYLRTRPGFKEIVKEKLSSSSIPFNEIFEGCIALANGTSLQQIVQLNKEAVVQDLSSQKVFDAAMQVIPKQPVLSVWDSCAASGGKSILFFDKMQSKMHLTVSDIRSSILKNLRERLGTAGIPLMEIVETDVSKKVQQITRKFDLIICDVPCTGSGTWARTPEQLAFFSAKKIDEYSRRQIAIAKNVIPFLKSNGLLIYITCSVFASENEAVIRQLTEDKKIKLLHSTYLEGYNQKADTLFVATLQKSKAE